MDGFALDWADLSQLHVVARQVAEGLYAGGHRSRQRGSGIEFGGHRNYLPGDDLRFIDHRALLRHGKLLIRQFEMDTDRSVHFMVDRSASMAFASTPLGTKYAYSALQVAALSRVANHSGDPISLSWLGASTTPGFRPSQGKEAFERMLASLAETAPGGDYFEDSEDWNRSLAAVRRWSRPGSIILLISDLFDLPTHAVDNLASLSASGRQVVVAQILDPAERDFQFDGAVKLRSSEGNIRIETDSLTAREAYLEALRSLAQRWSERLLASGGNFVRATTTDDPMATVLAILSAIEGRRP